LIDAPIACLLIMMAEDRRREGATAGGAEEITGTV
jgi:hypothetical protein